MVVYLIARYTAHLAEIIQSFAWFNWQKRCFFFYNNNNNSIVETIESIWPSKTQYNEFFGRVRESHSHINRFTSLCFIHLSAHILYDSSDVPDTTKYILRSFKRKHAQRPQQNDEIHSHTPTQSKGAAAIHTIEMNSGQNENKIYANIYSNIIVRQYFPFDSIIMGFSNFIDRRLGIKNTS